MSNITQLPDALDDTLQYLDYQEPLNSTSLAHPSFLQAANINYTKFNAIVTLKESNLKNIKRDIIQFIKALDVDKTQKQKIKNNIKNIWQQLLQGEIVPEEDLEKLKPLYNNEVIFTIQSDTSAKFFPLLQKLYPNFKVIHNITQLPDDILSDHIFQYLTYNELYSNSTSLVHPSFLQAAGINYTRFNPAAIAKVSKRLNHKTVKVDIIRSINALNIDKTQKQQIKNNIREIWQQLLQGNTAPEEDLEKLKPLTNNEVIFTSHKDKDTFAKFSPLLKKLYPNFKVIYITQLFSDHIFQYLTYKELYSNSISLVHPSFLQAVGINYTKFHPAAILKVSKRLNRETVKVDIIRSINALNIDKIQKQQIKNNIREIWQQLLQDKTVPKEALEKLEPVSNDEVIFNIYPIDFTTFSKLSPLLQKLYPKFSRNIEVISNIIQPLISEININDKFASSISTITVTQYYTHNIGPQLINDLLSSLHKCNNLQSLNLSSNGIGDDGIKYLKKALSDCTKLETLNLSSNGIGDEGAKELADTISNCTSLASINLSANEIRNEGAKYLSEICTLRTSFYHLDLTNNQIEMETIEYLARKLSQYEIFSIVKLSFGNIGVENARALGEFISKMPYHFFYIKFNDKLLQNAYNECRNQSSREKEAEHTTAISSTLPITNKTIEQSGGFVSKLSNQAKTSIGLQQ
ncbi:leucine-rich repeat domain-containing protein [Rickettsiales endosymbiont of Stachyamoeba lipophora]|uniref:hypothetical protein n=1 Tax=Rickettsiales endosymbiont of Stachyamoeba lipophora TaxID=2486578 RepID=UPI0013DDFFA6|nr:hypothetical protein [Rickettsiales endosymbiont of Stachyamoeba lipophora]